jgi:hypothetical protein
MNSAVLVPAEVWKLKKYHDMSVEARCLYHDICCSVDHDGICEVFPIIKAEDFDRNALLQVCASRMVFPLSLEDMIVYLEGFYELDKIYRTYKYKPSKYRDLLFRQRPDLKELFLTNTTKKLPSKTKPILVIPEEDPVLLEYPSENNINLILASCRSVDIPDDFSKACLERLKSIHNISDTTVFSIISRIYERMHSELLDIEFPEKYLQTCITNELRERNLIP